MAAEFEHGAGGYARGHRCGVCRAGHARQFRDRLARRKAALTVGEDGRPYAPWVTTHGRSSYINHGCRCAPCTTAAVKHKAEYRKRIRKATPK